MAAWREAAAASAGPMAAWREAAQRKARAAFTSDGSRGLHSKAAARTGQTFRARQGILLPGIVGSMGLAAGRGARRFHVLRDVVVEHVDGTCAALSVLFFSGLAGVLYLFKDADDQDEAQKDDHYTKMAVMREMEREREAYCTFMPEEKAVVQEYIEEDEAIKARFEGWMKEHGRTYKDEVEKARRFKIFKSSARCVDVSNADSIRRGSSARFCLNEFADWNMKEMAGLYGALPLRDEEFPQVAN